MHKELSGHKSFVSKLQDFPMDILPSDSISTYSFYAVSLPV